MSKKDYPVCSPVVFKKYNENQLILFINLESPISDNHIARVVNQVITQMKLEFLFALYPEGGNRVIFHPVTMIKLIVYAYADKNYSNCRIEKNIRGNTMHIRLCRGNYSILKSPAHSVTGVCQ